MKKPALMYEAMATTLDTVFEEIKKFRQRARANGQADDRAQLAQGLDGTEDGRWSTH